ncbi:ATP-binding protein [Anaerobacillus sp. MEB173]|uniref:ATP-binding protein n=1 Tax=Anaerobacillus sp. MEB173 TaxID=3383345 RepID=UPI003F92F964
MNKKLVISICIVYSIIYYFWIMTSNGSLDSLRWGGVIGIIGPVMAIAVIMLAIQTKRNEMEKKFWFLILCAFFSYLIAEIIWRYYLSFLGAKYTFPGFADFFYIIFVLLYAVALIYRVSLFWKGQLLKNIQLFFDAFIIITVVTTVCWVYFFKPILIKNESLITFDSVLTLAYPIAHLGLLLGIVLVYFSSKPIFPASVIYLNIIGLFIYIVSDFVYLAQSIYSSYQHFSLLTPIWNICLLLIAISSLYDRVSIKTGKDVLYSPFGTTGLRRIVIPYIGLFIFLFLLFINKDELTNLFVGGAFVLALIVIRQVITLKENDELLNKITQKTKELEKTKNKLLESEKKYKSLIDHHPNAIFSIDRQGNILTTNKECERLLALPQKQIIDNNWFTLLKSLKTENDFTLIYLHALKGNSQIFDMTITNHLDEKKYLRVTLIPSIVNGKVIALFVMVEDITEKKKTEELMLKSEKLSVVSRLAAGVAHEIRNPLTSVKGFLQMMNESTSVNKDYMTIVVSEINRVELIIQEFLSLAKPHHENLFESRNLAKTLKDVTDLLRTNAILDNVDITLVVQDDRTRIDCIESQLKQVVINLIQNAMEATGSNGRIAVEMHNVNNETVCIRVIDNGCGIPKERLHRLGEPFYSTKEKGTGIGLMVCFKIIEQHNGSMTFFSDEGQGTIVEISLPVIQKQHRKSVQATQAN